MSSLPGDFRFYPTLETLYEELDVFAMGVDVEWEQSDGTTSEPLSLLVAEDRQPYQKQLTAYRRGCLDLARGAGDRAAYAATGLVVLGPPAANPCGRRGAGYRTGAT